MSDREEFAIDSPGSKGTGNRIQTFLSKNKTFLLLLVFLAIVVSFLIYFGHSQAKINRDLTDALTTSNRPAEELRGDAHGDVLMSSNPLVGNLFGEEGKDDKQRHYLNIGIMRQDGNLLECLGGTGSLQLSFPDIDYALMGYNILRGFPLAIGHDPGFTYPIFAANYETKKQTADCRYSVPQGLVVVPDVSCITSFTSTIVQTQYEFANSLSVSASVSGGGWGVSFSASAGYKKSSSEISTGESVYIISSANCNYYFSKLVKRSPPPLDPVFLGWIERLSTTDSTDLYLEFLDTYGTHFPTEVTFGARFTYEHKMESKKYEKESESGVNVAVSASYSGIVNVGGGFSMDKSQREKASAFSKSVETKTISVGAPPPANGDALTWASTVKDSPVPSSYKLASIEELFTDKYLDETQLRVNLAHIARNINKTKREYCQNMISRGEVESCQTLSPGLMLGRTELRNYYDSTVSTYKECVDNCLKLIKCVAIDYCDTCKSYSNHYHTCYMYSTDRFISGEENESWKSLLIIGKSRKNLTLEGTDIIGTPRQMNEEGEDNVDDKTKVNETECGRVCMADAHCVAYSYCDCDEVEQKCKLYSFDNIKGFKKEPRATTIFVAKKED
ncbi:uncharacterized protein LOC132722693 [Ruditapes philippinarum]|uniref:uncharacterized protein LOC132722693 n=1 Tax=Ruditapes philippinarum TaxID=129788 RepID=UPI00295A85E1|nr:uncharacterized protein LOC132722693 [Ruditapes philippinarum]